MAGVREVAGDEQGAMGRVEPTERRVDDHRKGRREARARPQSSESAVS